MLNIAFRKTKRGRIQKIIKEVYLRPDIPCGYEGCPYCTQSAPILSIESEKNNYLFILDFETLLNQIDLIKNCPVLKNVIIFQTGLEELHIRKPESYNVLKNIIEIDTYRKFFIFPNEFYDKTYTTLAENESMEERNERAIMNGALFYKEHLDSLNVQILFITNSYKSHQIAKQKGLKSLTIHDFVNTLCQEYPSLVDYLGFFEEEMEIETKADKIYDSHMDLDKLLLGIKEGNFFKGKLSINRTSNEDGKVFIPEYGFEIHIKGKQNLNRGMNGDIIALKLLPEAEWAIKQHAAIEEDEENISDEVNISLPQSQETEASIKNIVKKINEKNLLPYGKVIGILKKSQRNYCGHLLQTNSPLEGSLYTFIPADSRYPNFFIKLRNALPLFTKKIVVGFNKWDCYSELPIGHFIGVIGDIGDLKTESQVILMEHNVETREFSQEVLACLPKEDTKWQIPDQEIKKRLDLRSINVVSIDPPGCKDIDDALHCIRLPNGNFQVGVHIADVSYFVKSDSAIDLEAAHRCTTVYLVEKRTDMLPKLLTETLCSLKGGEERLAFSVIWEMNQNAEIIKVDFKKTIIQSKRALNYGEAQAMIDNNNDQSDITKGIRDLNFLAKILKQKRIKNGALQLASTQVKFTFDEETHNATDVAFYHLYETNSLVEEFMLLANVAVAEKIVTHFPSNSVLRKHSSPKAIQIRDFSKLLDSLGYQLDYSTSKALADSLDSINRLNDPFFNKLIRIMTTRCMNEATYFCTADEDLPEFHHYGLACPLYTHFTSPIRRYADILVHRLLAASIDLESLPSTLSNKQKVKKMCEKMNMRNRMARFASRASSDYHTYLFFKGKSLIEDAMITNIAPNGFSVILPRYGLEGFINFNNEDKEKNKQKGKEISSKFWIKDKVHNLFDHVKVKIEVELKSFHKQINLEYVGV